MSNFNNTDFNTQPTGATRPEHHLHKSSEPLPGAAGAQPSTDYSTGQFTDSTSRTGYQPELGGGETQNTMDRLGEYGGGGMDAERSMGQQERRPQVGFADERGYDDSLRDNSATGATGATGIGRDEGYTDRPLGVQPAREGGVALGGRQNEELPMGKAGLGDKVIGKTQKVMGKMSNNPEMHEKGELREAGGIDALESGKLNLASGFVFGYGGRWCRLLGLRSQPYLNTLSSSSIRQKLEDQLRRHRKLHYDETFQDAWIMTMPSVLGFEGINPLTVYFCYQHQALWIVVLEVKYNIGSKPPYISLTKRLKIHNTFGESHVHLLEVGSNEDPIIAKGYEHQWTFRRQFHVSPFNDRSGFYTVSVKSPGISPRLHKERINLDEPEVLPAVSVRLYAEPEDTHSNIENAIPTNEPSDLASTAMLDRSSLGQLKLAAYLRTTSALPLTTWNATCQLARQPFALFLTMPRILYHAWILHFSKRLAVFPRPEPQLIRVHTELPEAHEVVPGGGVGWQEEGNIESYARGLVIEFLRRRAIETGISVALVPSNPNVPPTEIIATEKTTNPAILEINYLSPRVFTILFACPSSEHSLLLGMDTEAVFQVSSPALFGTVFSHSTRDQVRPSFLQRTLQSLRRGCVPAGLDITSPPLHFLDKHCTAPSLMLSTIAFCAIIFLDYLEKFIFQLTGARFVEGKEPWNAWKRAIELRKSRKPSGQPKVPGNPHIVYGSARRDD
ncbi:hypothetical protein NP233_g3244 [Leucocoprinus birnbaumii]|uniref:Uncharacterized protein n=1 Tax=Leucocoprinus birnbaumii TaxID=56174 RepID=A0AAD5W0P7_9AGAR|nr:hypothetical protein NP233_g3244 [Leucocoprinus birnbaumii]